MKYVEVEDMPEWIPSSYSLHDSVSVVELPPVKWSEKNERPRECSSPHELHMGRRAP